MRFAFFFVMLVGVALVPIGMILGGFWLKCQNFATQLQRFLARRAMWGLIGFGFMALVSLAAAVVDRWPRIMDLWRQ